MSLVTEALEHAFECWELNSEPQSVAFTTFSSSDITSGYLQTLHHTKERLFKSCSPLPPTPGLPRWALQVAEMV